MNTGEQLQAETDATDLGREHKKIDDGLGKQGYGKEMETEPLAYGCGQGMMTYGRQAS